jgi:hypothetical protein
MGKHRHQRHAENTAAPKVSRGCAKTAALLVASGERPVPVSGGRRSFRVKSYDLRSRRLGRAAPLVAHQQRHYNARYRRRAENATKQWHILRHFLASSNHANSNMRFNTSQGRNGE